MLWVSPDLRLNDTSMASVQIPEVGATLASLNIGPAFLSDAGY